MLRRVARGLRVGLFVMGSLALLWFPVSFLLAFEAVTSHDGVRIEWGVASLSIAYGERPSPHTLMVPNVGFDEAWDQPLKFLVFPQTFTWGWSNTGQRVFTLPLWLLAAVCLAWPVTSFIARRRRQKQGFPVARIQSDGLAGPASIAVICPVRTNTARLSHSCRVYGGGAAATLAGFLRSRGVPVRVTHAGRDKRIIHFPESASAAEVEADRQRYEMLVSAHHVDRLSQDPTGGGE